MQRFEYSTIINASVRTVWNFHDRADILQILTPPWQPVEVVRREGGLGIGAESEFRLWLGPLPVTWLSRHVECEPPFLFSDLQVKGPMEHWLHQHRLEPIEGSKTRLTDEITYALPSSQATEPLLEKWITARLGDMFGYRHRVTQLACEQLDVAESNRLQLNQPKSRV